MSFALPGRWSCLALVLAAGGLASEVPSPDPPVHFSPADVARARRRALQTDPRTLLVPMADAAREAYELRARLFLDGSREGSLDLLLAATRRLADAELA